MDDNSTPDPNIFTIDTASNTKSLQIYSDDITEAITYSFEVSVVYDSFGSVSDDAIFDVIITDNCSDSATSTASNTVIPNQTYTVDGSGIQVSFDAFTANPIYCPLTYDCVQQSVPSPPNGLLSID